MELTHTNPDVWIHWDDDIRETLRHVRRLRRKMRVVITENHKIVFDVTAKRDKFNLDSIPECYQHRHPQRFTVDNTRKPLTFQLDIETYHDPLMG